MTDGYVRELARQAYFWAWPMVNVHNRLLAYEQLPGPGLAGGVLPVGPPNRLGMFTDDTPEDRVAIQRVINQIDAYPLSAFDGKTKVTDWTNAQKFPGDTGSTEVKWVKPELFVSQLPAILDLVPPLPGEDAMYQEFRALVAAADKDTRLKQLITEAAIEAEDAVVKPLFQFRNYGLPLPHNWTTITNGAQVGTDYYTRTAVAKSNILVNKPNETRYFYQDLDATGQRLRGDRNYRVTFAKDQLPPVRGFWSLTLYNEHHFFHPNELKRYSLGTKNRTLQRGADGSLTLSISAHHRPSTCSRTGCPRPVGSSRCTCARIGPRRQSPEGRWTPPAVTAL